MQTILERSKQALPKRGLSLQRARRRREQMTRRSAVAFSRWLSRRGLGTAQIAQHLGIARRTLNHWKLAWRERRLRWRGRGRPSRRATREQRGQLLSLIDLLGPQVGVPVLQAACPSVARREAAYILHRYRRAWRRRQKTLTHCSVLDAAWFGLGDRLRAPAVPGGWLLLAHAGRS